MKKESQQPAGFLVNRLSFYPPQLLLPPEDLLQLDLAETVEPKPPLEIVRLTVGLGLI